MINRLRLLFGRKIEMVFPFSMEYFQVSYGDRSSDTYNYLPNKINYKQARIKLSPEIRQIFDICNTPYRISPSTFIGNTSIEVQQNQWRSHMADQYGDVDVFLLRSKKPTVIVLANDFLRITNALKQSGYLREQK